MARSAYVVGAVERALRELVTEQFEPGNRLPSERELAEMVDASRATVREVVSVMCRSGELVRRWGVGTFVAETVRPFALSLSLVGPLQESAQLQGFEAEISDVVCDLLPCETKSGQLWNLAPDARVWRVSRLLRLDGSPAVHLVDVLPERLNGNTLDFGMFPTLAQPDFIAFVADQCGLRLITLNAIVRAEHAERDTAELFGIPVGSPLILSDSTGFAADGTVVTRSAFRYVPGRVELHVQGHGAPP